MKTHPIARLSRARLGLMALVGLFAVGERPGAAQAQATAQAQDTIPLALIVAVFPGPAAAGQAMANMKTAEKQRVESYAVVSKDQKGDVKVREKQAKKGGRSPRASNAVDGAVALLGRVPAATARDTAGAAGQAGVSKETADKLRNMLAPGNSAIILVVAEPAASDMNSALEQAHSGQVLEAELSPEP